MDNVVGKDQGALLGKDRARRQASQYTSRRTLTARRWRRGGKKKPVKTQKRD